MAKLKRKRDYLMSEPEKAETLIYDTNPNLPYDQAKAGFSGMHVQTARDKLTQNPYANVKGEYDRARFWGGQSAGDAIQGEMRDAYKRTNRDMLIDPNRSPLADLTPEQLRDVNTPRTNRDMIREQTGYLEGDVQLPTPRKPVPFNSSAPPIDPSVSFADIAKQAEQDVMNIDRQDGMSLAERMVRRQQDEQQAAQAGDREAYGKTRERLANTNPELARQMFGSGVLAESEQYKTAMANHQLEQARAKEDITRLPLETEKTRIENEAARNAPPPIDPMLQNQLDTLDSELNHLDGLIETYTGMMNTAMTEPEKMKFYEYINRLSQQRQDIFNQKMELVGVSQSQPVINPDTGEMVNNTGGGVVNDTGGVPKPDIDPHQKIIQDARIAETIGFGSDSFREKFRKLSKGMWWAQNQIYVSQNDVLDMYSIVNDIDMAIKSGIDIETIRNEISSAGNLSKLIDNAKRANDNVLVKKLIDIADMVGIPVQDIKHFEDSSIFKMHPNYKG